MDYISDDGPGLTTIGDSHNSKHKSEREKSLCTMEETTSDIMGWDKGGNRSHSQNS